MSGAPAHATYPRSLFNEEEEGRVSLGQEHSMAGVIQLMFPHASLGLEGDDSNPTIEPDEALGICLAFMVPAQGKDTQLTRAIMQSGGMRKFGIPMKKINDVLQAVGEAISDLVGGIKEYNGLRKAVISRWSRLQGDPRVRLDPSDLIPYNPPPYPGWGSG